MENDEGVTGKLLTSFEVSVLRFNPQVGCVKARNDADGGTQVAPKHCECQKFKLAFGEEVLLIVWMPIGFLDFVLLFKPEWFGRRTRSS